MRSRYKSFFTKLLRYYRIIVYVFPESNPLGKITRAESGYEITLQCSVSYSGLWPPTVEWRHNEQTEESASELAKNRVSATLKIWPTADKRIYSQYSCVTYFDASNKPENSSASNVPSFTYTWTPRKRIRVYCIVLYSIYRFIECLSQDKLIRGAPSATSPMRRKILKTTKNNTNTLS